GTWSSSNTAVATVSSFNTSTGIITGVSGGTAIITFAAVAGCKTVKTMTVNPTAPVTGITSVCVGQTTTLGNAIPGGTWTSSNPGLATVTAATGVVTGVRPGASTLTIKYNMPTGCVISSAPVTVKPLMANTGPATVCQGSRIVLANGTHGGGTWSSSN